MYVCGPTVYGAASHRARPFLARLRRAAPLPRMVRRRRPTTSRMSPTSTTRSSPGPTRRDGRRQEIAERVRGSSGGRRWTRSGSLRPTTIPHATEYIDADGRRSSPSSSSSGSPTRPTTASTSRSRTSPTTGCSPIRASTRCGPVHASRSTRRSGRPSTSRSGRRRSPASPRGRRRSAPAAPAGTPSAWSMSLDLLGEGFDLHGGGQDLIFPHHENERAQAVALGRRFARHWMHNGMVDGEAARRCRSRSANFTSLRRLFDCRSSIRARTGLLVLRSHYRSPIVVTAETRSTPPWRFQARDTLHRDWRIAGRPARWRRRGADKRRCRPVSTRQKLPFRRAHGRRPRHPGRRSAVHLRTRPQGQRCRRRTRGRPRRRTARADAVHCFGALGLERRERGRSGVGTRARAATRRGSSGSGTSRSPTRFVPRSSRSVERVEDTRWGHANPCAESGANALRRCPREQPRSRRKAWVADTLRRLPGCQSVAPTGVSAPPRSWGARPRGTSFDLQS